MRRNNRNQDYYHNNRRNYNYREEDEDQEEVNANTNNRFGPYPNQRMKKYNNGHARQNQKPDKFSLEQLRNLTKPLKQPQGDKKQDFKKDQAKNQCAPRKQYIPRGGKIYAPQNQNFLKKLDDQMQQYNQKKIKTNLLQQEKLRKVNSNTDSDDSDWDIVGQSNKIKHNSDKKEISSLSFSVDIPPLEVKETNEIKDKKLLQKVKSQDKTEIKQIKQYRVVKQQLKLKQFNRVEQEKSEKTENFIKEIKKLNKLNQANIMEQTKNQLEANQLQETIKVTYNIQSHKEEIKQQVIVFSKLIDAIELHQQQKMTNYLNEDKNIRNERKELQKKKSDELKRSKEQLIKLGQSNKRAKIYLTFQAIENIQSFTIKEIQLRQIGMPLKLDSDGRPKIKESYNITTEQLNRYIKFFKTSHYFPKLGRFQEQAQHFVDIAQNRQIVLDQTNQVDFQFCEIKVSDQQQTEQKKDNKSSISINIVSLLCMICGSKNQVVVFQNDMTAVCSCKGNDCSQRIFGRFGKVRVEILQT